MLHPEICFVMVLGRTPGPGAVARIRGLPARWPGCEVLLVARGDAEALAGPLRSLADADPCIHALLHTRPTSTDAALAAAVQAARAAWILRLPEESGGAGEAAAIDRLLQHPDRGLGSRDALLLADDGPILFKRGAFLQLPRIPAMSRVLAELLDRRGRGLRRLGGPGPLPRRAARALRRAYAALACTMGLWWTPARRTA